MDRALIAMPRVEKTSSERRREPTSVLSGMTTASTRLASACP